MKRIIAQHKYKNGKAISVGICDIKKLPKCDKMFLEIKDKDKIYTFYMRPDEIVLTAKLLTELILKKVITYEVSVGEKTDKDY